MTMTAIAHAPFCLPQPGRDEPRIDRFNYTRDDGQIAHTDRCLECGEQVVTWLGKL